VERLAFKGIGKKLLCIAIHDPSKRALRPARCLDAAEKQTPQN
jgi:hypothetical protein